ncbi:MAG: hypothetical protein ACOWWO_02545 [Peptococcaceae bacterium]
MEEGKAAETEVKDLRAVKTGGQSPGNPEKGTFFNINKYSARKKQSYDIIQQIPGVK